MFEYPSPKLNYKTKSAEELLLNDACRVYHGIKKSEKRWGLGTLVSSEGNYEGQWLDNKFHGIGKLALSKNFKNEDFNYIGEFQNSFRSGIGYLSCEDSDIIGKWLNDDIEGIAEVKLKKRNRIKIARGSFLAGEVHGFANLLAYDEDDESIRSVDVIEEGPIDLMDVAEISKLKNYYLAQGGFKLGQLQGTCKVYEDDSVFVGEFKDGEKNGVGIKTREEAGEVVKGFYRNNRLNGFGIIMNSKKKNIYSGDLRDGFKHGQGKEVDQTAKSCYIGNFKDGKRNGFGKFTKEKELYMGGWHNNKRNGLGYCELQGDFTYFGFFEMGKLEGIGMMIKGNKEIKAEFYQDLLHGRALISIKGKGNLFVNYYKGKLEKELDPSMLDDFLEEFEILNSEKFFRIAKKKVIEVDSGVRESCDFLKIRLGKITNAEYDDESMEIKKHIEEYYTRISNLRTCHQRNMKSLKIMLEEKKEEESKMKPKVPKINLDVAVKEATTLVGEMSTMLESKDVGILEDALGTTVDYSELKSKIGEGMETLRSEDVVVGESLKEAIILKHTGIEHNRDIIPQKNPLELKSSRIGESDRVLKLITKRDNSPVKASKTVENYNQYGGLYAKRRDKRIKRVSIKKEKSLKREMKRYKVISSDGSKTGMFSKHRVDSKVDIEKEFSFFDEFKNRVENGETDEMGLPDFKRKEPKAVYTSDFQKRRKKSYDFKKRVLENKVRSRLTDEYLDSYGERKLVEFKNRYLGDNMSEISELDMGEIGGKENPRDAYNGEDNGGISETEVKVEEGLADKEGGDGLPSSGLSAVLPSNKVSKNEPILNKEDKNGHSKEDNSVSLKPIAETTLGGKIEDKAPIKESLEIKTPEINVEPTKPNQAKTPNNLQEDSSKPSEGKKLDDGTQSLPKIEKKKDKLNNLEGEQRAKETESEQPKTQLKELNTLGNQDDNKENNKSEKELKPKPKLSFDEVIDLEDLPPLDSEDDHNTFLEITDSPPKIN